MEMQVAQVIADLTTLGKCVRLVHSLISYSFVYF